MAAAGEQRDRCSALGAARQPSRNGTSGPLKATADFAVAPVSVVHGTANGGGDGADVRGMVRHSAAADRPGLAAPPTRPSAGFPLEHQASKDSLSAMPTFTYGG
jgi:hypothetical protein